MPTLKWRPQALNDLEAIESYYEEVAPEYASYLVEQILEKVEQLANFPRMGRIVPEIDDKAIRELIHENYRIIYVLDPEDTEVEVLTVIHSSRQLGSLNDNDD